MAPHCFVQSELELLQLSGNPSTSGPSPSLARYSFSLPKYTSKLRFSSATKMMWLIAEMSPGFEAWVTCTDACAVVVAPWAPVAVNTKATVPKLFKVTLVEVCAAPIGTLVPFWERVTLVAFVVVQVSATACPTVTVVGFAVRVAVGPDGGGAAVTFTEACAVAAVVPDGPLAVKVNVVVPTVLRVKGIPGELSGLPSRGTVFPFSSRLMVLAF